MHNNIIKKAWGDGMTWSDRAGKYFCYICIGVGIYVAIKYFFFIFLPFLIAWGLAILTAPLSKKLSRRLGLSRKFCSFVITFLIIGGTAALLYLGISRLFYEAERLISRLYENSESIGSSVSELLNKLSSFGDRKNPILESLLQIDQFREIWENVDQVISSMLSNALSAVTRWIPSVLLSVFKKLPSVLIFLLITVISCFYFAADIDRINKKAVLLLPVPLRARIPSIKRQFLDKSSRYLRAYVILLLLTFGELFVGLSILRTPYPLLLAIFISILDILPILGVGTILIPWAAVELLFTKDYYTGVGLLIIYVIITVVRQVTEPRIVGGSLGLHPLLTLISMYVGLQLFGFLGALLAPMVIIVLRSLKSSPLRANSVDSEA